MRQARLGEALGLYQVTVLSRWKPSSCIAKPIEKMTCCVPETQIVPEGLSAAAGGAEPGALEGVVRLEAARRVPAPLVHAHAPAGLAGGSRRSTGGRAGPRR